VLKLAKKKQMSAHTYSNIQQVSFIVTQQLQDQRTAAASLSLLSINPQLLHFSSFKIRSSAQFLNRVMVTKWLKTKGKIFQKQEADKSQNEGMASHMLKHLIRRQSHLLRLCLLFSLQKQSCTPPAAFCIYQILSYFWETRSVLPSST